jgi:hypothetical protein
MIKQITLQEPCAIDWQACRDHSPAPADLGSTSEVMPGYPVIASWQKGPGPANAPIRILFFQAPDQHANLFGDLRPAATSRERHRQ